MELPEKGAATERALPAAARFNARAWCTGLRLEGNHVVLTDTLELENLDFSEFEASFDSISWRLPRIFRARTIPGRVKRHGTL